MNCIKVEVIRSITSLHLDILYFHRLILSPLNIILHNSSYFLVKKKEQLLLYFDFNSHLKVTYI